MPQWEKKSLFSFLLTFKAAPTIFSLWKIMFAHTTVPGANPMKLLLMNFMSFLKLKHIFAIFFTEITHKIQVKY